MSTHRIHFIVLFRIAKWSTDEKLSILKFFLKQPHTQATHTQMIFNCIPLWNLKGSSSFCLDRACTPLFVMMCPCYERSLSWCVPFCCSLAVCFFSLSVCGMLILSERAASLPELTPAQRNKLRHLSIISLASNLKVEYHPFIWF